MKFLRKISMYLIALLIGVLAGRKSKTMNRYGSGSYGRGKL